LGSLTPPEVRKSQMENGCLKFSQSGVGEKNVRGDKLPWIGIKKKYKQGGGGPQDGRTHKGPPGTLKKKNQENRLRGKGGNSSDFKKEGEVK